MTTNHIDQLAQWWHDAEEGTGKAGDVIIEHDDSPNFETPSYVVFTLGRDEHENLTYRRILARAPKPAWHNAVAVIARCSNAPEGHREPFIRSEVNHDVWAGEAGRARTDDLRDAIPLVEAKVTGAMTVAAISAYRGIDRSALSEFTRDEVEDMRRALAAALGLETE